MLRHMVLFNLKRELAGSAREALFAKMQRFFEIASVENVEVGSLLEPTDPAYRKRMASDFEFALLVDFIDEEGLYAYQQDPQHVKVAQELRKSASAIKVMDFIIRD